ncbi:putative NADH-ubiquinone oxidoreductase 21 kDa subunit [Patellaria atrata CBS 101060]|uniref:NADH-ubiquinone oxidoreductase 21 kDa subunit n=1 Tax=Patellaria atrata CBS 101060 TaxID=1346257 RepID=A0A9P4VPB3_9PEZI|nr:putative NADH-ubiquinone oxidoreductase 21 kDa subunit [Patellaria atrata CBS 101060]
MTVAGAKVSASAAKQATKFKKYTVQPTGIWKYINKFLAVDSSRSTGIPLNPQFRNPPPGSNDPNAYDDPVTVPAADLAENPYWKRDVRRRYMQPSVVKPADVVGLLTVGSKANPKEEVLKIGQEGQKQLVAVKEEGEKGGLAAFFEKNKDVAKSVLGQDGLPPFPSGLSPLSSEGKRYEILDEQSYDGKYPCRTFQ